MNEDILAPEPDEAVMSMSAVKNHEIPKLGSYSEIPDSSFWDNFPKKELPLVAETLVNVDTFEEEIENVKSFTTSTE